VAILGGSDSCILANSIPATKYWRQQSKQRVITFTTTAVFVDFTAALEFRGNSQATGRSLDRLASLELGRLKAGLVQNWMSVQVSKNAVETRWASSPVKRLESAAHTSFTAKTAGFNFRLRATCNSLGFMVEQPTGSAAQILRSL
jgi:hypothetical protein